MLPAIVLAAGASRRMGQPKAGLIAGPGGDSFLTTIVRTLLAGGCSRVTVVAGAHPAEVRAALDPALAGHAGVVEHAGWADGQLSSLLAGLSAVEAVAEAPVEAVVVTLVDVPQVLPGTVALLLKAWRGTRAPVVRPRVGTRHGHPIIVSACVFDALRQADLATGARPVIAALGTQVLDVDVDDPGVLRDLDTPEDYRALQHSR